MSNVVASNPAHGPAHAGPVDGAGAHNLLIDVLWIIFLIGITSAPHPLGITNVERYFWFPADLAIVALAAFRRGQFLQLASKHAVFLTWPLLACASAIWSLSAGTSLYHGLQLLMTILVAFMLCIYAPLERILQLLFAALLACAVMSVLYALARGPLDGEWLGVFPHKNVLGHMMTLLITTGCCLFLAGWRPWLTACGVALGLALLLLSRSGTSVLALAIVLAVLPFAFSIRAGLIGFAMSAGLALIGGAILALALEIMNVDFVASVLRLLGKDETLTGRTILWEFGVEAFQSRPWLGFGYKGYWDSPDTPALLLRTVIGQDLWFFHNNLLDVAVAFGFTGPILLVAGLIVAVISALKTFAAHRGSVALWPLLYVVFVAILSTAENPLFQNHSIHQFLLIVAVAARVQNGDRPSVQRAYRASRTSAA